MTLPDPEYRANADVEAPAHGTKSAGVESVSRLAAGRTAAATSERTDVTAGETAPSFTGPRLITLRAEAAEGDREMILRIVEQLLRHHGFDVQYLEELPRRPCLEILLTPEREVWAAMLLDAAAANAAAQAALTAYERAMAGARAGAAPNAERPR